MSLDAGTETLGSHTSDPSPEQGPEQAKVKEIAGKSPLRIAMDRLRADKVAMVCAAVVLLFVLIAIFAGTIAKILGVDLEPGNPAKQLDYLNGGMPLEGPPNGGFDPDHPFGIAPKTATDNLAYWLYGCRTSMLIATLSTVVAATIGIVLGIIAGFTGGIVDRIISFIIDVFLTIPFLLMALTIAPIVAERFALSENYRLVQIWTLIGILSFFGWMSVARLVRGEVLSLREREFVQAARVMGMPTSRIMVRELLPNLVAPIMVSVSIMLPAFIAAEAGLAFLGIGVTQGASWGQTILRAAEFRFFKEYPLYLWEPLLGIVILVIALNLLGDAIRDAVDPKTRR